MLKIILFAICIPLAFIGLLAYAIGKLCELIYNVTTR